MSVLKVQADYGEKLKENEFLVQHVPVGDFAYLVFDVDTFNGAAERVANLLQNQLEETSTRHDHFWVFSVKDSDGDVIIVEAKSTWICEIITRGVRQQ